MLRRFTHPLPAPRPSRRGSARRRLCRPACGAHGTAYYHVAIASAVVDSFDIPPDAVCVLCDRITAAVNNDLGSDYAAAR
jgi:hypothetical protein